MYMHAYVANSFMFPLGTKTRSYGIIMCTVHIIITIYHGRIAACLYNITSSNGRNDRRSSRTDQ